MDAKKLAEMQDQALKMLISASSTAKLVAIRGYSQGQQLTEQTVKLLSKFLVEKYNMNASSARALSISLVSVGMGSVAILMVRIYLCARFV